jgi:hypothetical protein
MKKAFFINGGAGRVLCSIPALEYHIKNIDATAPIIAEGWQELFLLSKILRNNVYGPTHQKLFDIVKDREIITPEPYRLNAYFNQNCNLIQAFDILINELTEIPETKSFNIEIGKSDDIMGKNIVEECKSHLQKDKVIIFQPFGSGAKISGKYVIEESGRSFEIDDIVNIIKQLKKNYGIILMSEFKLPLDEPLGIMTPEGMNLLQWSGVIRAADYFLGCDSVGQHMANALNKPSTVVIGSTFPENISYPENIQFNIIDNGKNERIYSPIRISSDVNIERNNENLMKLDFNIINKLVNDIEKTLGENTYMKQNISSNCCVK